MPHRWKNPTPTFDDLPDMVPINVAAAYLSVSPQAVCKDLDRGDNLREFRIGRRRLVRKGSLAPGIERETMLASGKGQPAWKVGRHASEDSAKVEATIGESAWQTLLSTHPEDAVLRIVLDIHITRDRSAR
jgi:hypothetical protein